MYSHIAIVVAILMTTVATIYLNLTKVNLTFVAWLIVASIGLYYLVLFVNVIYSKNSCHFSKKDITLLILIFIVGAVLVLALRQKQGGNDDYLVHLECSLCYVCWHKKSK
jgi:low temperature requirement protein LtrA